MPSALEPTFIRPATGWRQIVSIPPGRAQLGIISSLLDSVTSTSMPVSFVMRLLLSAETSRPMMMRSF